MMTLDEGLTAEVVVTENRIGGAVDRLAREIVAAYPPGAELVAVVLLMGAKPFADDLLTRLTRLGVAVTVQYLRVSSYHGTTCSSGEVTIEGWSGFDPAGKRVLLIDDIYDSGRTLFYVIERLKRCYGAAEVKTCVLLEKQRPHEQPVTIDFLGLSVPDVFLVGYGLDYQERFRELPFIAEMKA